MVVKGSETSSSASHFLSFALPCVQTPTNTPFVETRGRGGGGGGESQCEREMLHSPHLQIHTDVDGDNISGVLKKGARCYIWYVMCLISNTVRVVVFYPRFQQ